MLQCLCTWNISGRETEVTETNTGEADRPRPQFGVSILCYMQLESM